MNRALLLIFSGILIISSVMGINDPADSLQWIFATDPVFDAIRFGIAIGLILVAIFQSTHDEGIQILLRGLGISFLLIALLAAISPTFWGLSNAYILPFDMFLTIQTGIICLLTVLDMEEADVAEDTYRSLTYRVLIKDGEAYEDKSAGIPVHTSRTSNV